jgi:hypothetical protein
VMILRMRGTITPLSHLPSCRSALLSVGLWSNYRHCIWGDRLATVCRYAKLPLLSSLSLTCVLFLHSFLVFF